MGRETKSRAGAREPGTIADDLSTLRTAVTAATARERRLGICLLYAAASLKGDASEGGLTADGAAAARRWKAALLAGADEALRRIGHLSALGGTIGVVALPTETVTSVDHEPDDRLPRPAPASPEVFSALAAELGRLPNEELAALSRLTAKVAQPGTDAAAMLATVDWERAKAAVDGLTGDGGAASAVRNVSGLAEEFAAAADQARAAGDDFRAVRPMPSLPPPRDDSASGASLLVAPTTADAATLAVDAYGAMLQAASSGQSPAAAPRLLRSVVRPLFEALAQVPPQEGGGGAPPADLADPLPTRDAPAMSIELGRLATIATELWARPGLPVEIGEAVAGLQALVAEAVVASGHDPGGAMAAFGAAQHDLPSRLQTVPNGPYLAINVATITDWLGKDVATRPTVALCRCGRSSTKPWCDGSHAFTDFADAKDSDRVPDRRDRYDGVQVTVLDNRGLCAHSGFCTDRLASVFHQGSEPFVTPSGGRLDEIMRAVRDCPSGALSFAIDGREHRDDVDQVRPPAIEVSKDGPYRVTGGIPLVDGAGGDIARNAGASSEHYSLCRCGHSRNKPFCSGMHWYSDFRDPPPAADRPPTLFEWAGGFPALLRMTRLFYEKHVPEEPMLAPLFADMSPDHPQRVAAWLGEVFGGPKRYSERYGGAQGGYARMISQHLGKNLTEAWRARWVELLSRSADEAGLPTDPEFRSAFAAYLEWGSRIALENSQPGAHPPPRMPVPRWDWGTAGPPGGRVSALAPPPTTPDAPMPKPGEPIGFAQHIKPLFRQSDRESMRWAFDLWSYDDVRRHAAAIADRLRAGTMPCDGPWPAERVDVVQRWLDAGSPE